MHYRRREKDRDDNCGKDDLLTYNLVSSADKKLHGGRRASTMRYSELLLANTISALSLNERWRAGVVCRTEG